MKHNIQLNFKEFLFTYSCILCFLHNKFEVSGREPAPKDCEPKSCGHGINVSYPFWLEGGQQPSYCGYPPLKLNCKDDSTTKSLVLNVTNIEFYIKNIFYDNQSVLIIPSEFADHSCPIPHINLTVDINPLIVSTANDIIFFLLNCSNPLHGYNNISCTGDEKLDYFGGVFGNNTELNQETKLCKFVKVPTVRYTKENSNNVVGILRDGWLVNWDMPGCSFCRESGGTCGYNTSKANDFMCICSDRVHKVHCKRRKGIQRKIIIIGIVSVLAGSCLIFLLLFLLHSKTTILDNLGCFNVQKAKHSPSFEKYLNKYGVAGPKQYKYSEIRRMTRSFGEKLGQGGFGTVFKGTLLDGQLVAVKVLNEAKGNGEDFINEVASISRTSHVNIVSLLGYCMEKSKRILVCEYMPNGSLDKFIYASKFDSETTLGSNKLFEIAIGIARGLEYLHRGCNTRIVHFDIKPHNILLDKDLNPKISDFGLAKLYSPKECNISMVAARGTVGYIAPEVFSRKFGVASTKSDVYSYGMMVLEMVGGRKNIDATVDNSSEIYFPHWIYDNLDFYCQSEIAEVTNETEEIAKKMIIVSLWCIQTMPENRPSMSQVVNMLEGNIHDLEMPPKP